MKSTRINYLVVGTFVLATIAGLVIAVSLLTGRTGATDRYYTVFRNVTGIDFGTRVLYEGFPIGQVENVHPFDEDGQLKFKVDISVSEGWAIPDDSNAQIAASGLLAAVTIGINAGRSKTSLQPGSRIPSTEAANVIDAMSSLAIDFSRLAEEDIRPLLRNLNRSAGTVADLLDEGGVAMVDDLRNVITDVGDRVPAIFAEIDAITGKLNQSADRISQVLNEQNIQEVETIIADLGTASRNMATLTREIGETREAMDKLLIDIDAVVIDNRPDVDRSINSLRHSAESVARHIDAINENLEGAARNLFEFSRQIRQNPSLLLNSGTPPRDPAAKK